MSSNHHSPLIPDVSRANTTDLNAPLSDLDEAITDLQAFALGISYPSGSFPEAGEEISIPITSSLKLPASLAGTKYYANAAPDAEVVVSFKKNGSQFGTMAVAAGGSSATFAGSETTFAAGDRLSVVFPDPQDISWKGPCITLKGTKVI